MRPIPIPHPDSRSRPVGPARRDFIRAMSGFGTVCFAGCDPVEEAGSAPGFIDAHVHVWTPDTAKYPLAPGFEGREMAPPSFTPEELFAHAVPEGVSRVVLIQMSFYQYDNRYLLDMMAAHPEVFGGVAIIDPDSSGASAAMEELGERGVRGFRLYSSVEKVSGWEDSPGMNRMWRQGAESGQAMCLLSDPEALPLIHAMCSRHPETPVVIDHFSRIGMRGPVGETDLDQLCRLAEFPKVHVKTSAFYALGEKKAPYTDLGPMIRRLRDAFGADRLLWASDCPFQVGEGHTYQDSIALIRDRLDFLSREDKEAMLRGTAERVFFG